MSLRRVFIYLLRPRWHRKSFRTATRYPAPTTPEQPDFAHGKFLVFCNLQPTKSACSAATGNGLSGMGQPLSSVSGRKRYNTLDFASKIVCQVELRPLWIPLPRATLFPFGYPMPTGMLLAPIGNPEPRDCIPLDTRIFSSQMVPTLKNCVLPCRTFSRKCHSTRHSFLQRLCKNLNLCRGVPSKNSVFANTENFLVTLLRQKNNSGLFVDSTWSAISKIFFKNSNKSVVNSV